jgi:hypothetical protein
VRGDTASDCPDAATVETQAAARLGDNPFSRPPTQFIEAVVTRQLDTLQVSIAMRGADGKLIGNRSLSSTASDCNALATAAALTIAILIDPEVLLRSVPPPAPPPPRPPAPRGPRGRATLLALGGWGQLPQPAPGAGLAATVDIGRRAAVGLVTGFFPERRTATPDDGFGFGLAYGQLIGCFVPLGGGGTESGGGSWLRWELCAGVSANMLHAVVYGAQPANPGQRWYAGLAQMTRLIIGLTPALFLEVGVEASEPLPRRTFFVEGRPAGMDTVFTQPVVSMAGWMGVGLRWR